MDKEFCLLDESWIKVLNDENEIIEVSLIDVFTNAHKYKRLAGETVTQDVAILRLLLAIAITVFYRYDADGREDDVLNYSNPEDEILDRWSDYWEKGMFESDAFYNYLEKYRERFYLFHPVTPFWQVADLKMGTDYGTVSLLGNIKESNNTDTMHHFHMTYGKYIENLSYSEAARWLIYTNAYSVNVKTKIANKFIPVGIGRLSQLGFICVEDASLFNTILLNLCALNNQGDAWARPLPIWEQDIRQKPGIEISPPDNLAQLYTIQSRRLLLKKDTKDGKRITGFKSTGGDYYSTINDYIEPMTLLKWIDKEKNNFQPQIHKKEIAAWREFPSLFVEDELKPGLISWLERLSANFMIDNESLITFQMTGLLYADKTRYTNGELINESVSLSKDLLNEIGKIWLSLIIDQINKCENVDKICFYKFAQTLTSDMYIGDNKGSKDVIKVKTNRIQNKLSESYYYKIDSAFREWLLSIDPNSSNRDNKLYEWQATSSAIADNIVKKYIFGLNPQYTLLSTHAYKAFKTALNKLYSKKHEKGGD